MMKHPTGHMDPTNDPYGEEIERDGSGQYIDPLAGPKALDKAGHGIEPSPRPQPRSLKPGDLQVTQGTGPANAR